MIDSFSTLQLLQQDLSLALPPRPSNRQPPFLDRLPRSSSSRLPSLANPPQLSSASRSSSRLLFLASRSSNSSKALCFLPHNSKLSPASSWETPSLQADLAPGLVPCLASDLGGARLPSLRHTARQKEMQPFRCNPFPACLLMLARIFRSCALKTISKIAKGAR